MKKSALKRSLSKSIRAKFWNSNHAPKRFRNFQHWLLAKELEPEIHLFLCLFAMDGLRVDDYKCAIKSNPVSYAKDKIGIGWVDINGRQHRIRLGKLSLRLLGLVTWEQVQSLPLEILGEHYSIFTGIKQSLESFTQDQEAWFAEISSGVLNDHFVGLNPLTALSDSCYARKMKMQALARDEQIFETEGVVYEALEGWMEARGNDNNPIFIDQIVQLCKRGKVDDRQNQKALILKRCESILYEVTDAGPITSLILAWVADLTINGTRTRSNISVSTIVNYVNVLARPLFSSFRNQKIQDFSLSKFEETYSFLIHESSGGQKRNMASAINSWHRFLVSWVDVPILKKRFHDDVPISIPSANVLWQHEYDQVQSWLSNSTMDKRLTLYLRAMFSLSFKLRIRINELLKLRLNDVQFFENVLQIRIRGTKSFAAKRRIEIRVSDCPEFIELINYRKSEYANIDDFIFADPNRLGKIFRLSKLFTHANELLKAVTGDYSIRFHSLSHSVITFELENELIGGTDSLTNPLHQQATNFGHFTILTSCSEYMHCFEDAIRETIDRDLNRLIITSEIAARWSGKQAATIRKQVSRTQANKNLIYWQLIQAITPSPLDTDVCQGFQLINPIPPNFLSRSESLTLSKILDVLTDIQNGMAVEVVAIRQFIDVEIILAIINASKNVLLKSKCGGVHFKFSSDQTMKKITDAEWLNFKKARRDKNFNLIKMAQNNQLLWFKGIDAWCLVNSFGYFSLENDVCAYDFLSMLSIIDLSVSHLAIAHSPDCSMNKVRTLQSIFFKYFNATIPEFEVAHRGGRPKVYLLVSSKRISANYLPPSAALSISSLNAIFFAMAVFREIVSEQ